MKEAALDELIANMIKEFEKEGIDFYKDTSWPQFIKYKFVLETEIAERMIGEMFEEIKKSQTYGIIESKWFESDRFAPLKLGFKRLPARENRNWLQNIKYAFGGAVFGFRHYDNLNHFATAYIVDSSSVEAARIREDGRLEYPANDKSVLIITTLNRRNCRMPFSDLMRTFYSIYQKLKTPSET